MRGKGQHPHLRMARAHTPQRLEPTHAGHGDIHDHDIGLELGIKRASGLARLRLADHGDPAGRLQQEAKAGAYHRVIIDQQHTNHAAAFRGISAAR